MRHHKQPFPPCCQQSEQPGFRSLRNNNQNGVSAASTNRPIRGRRDAEKPSSQSSDFREGTGGSQPPGEFRETGSSMNLAATTFFLSTKSGPAALWPMREEPVTTEVRKAGLHWAVCGLSRPFTTRHAATEVPASHCVEKRMKSHQCQRTAPFARKTTEGGLEKELANLWRRSKVTKNAHASRGPEAKWEIPVEL